MKKVSAPNQMTYGQIAAAHETESLRRNGLVSVVFDAPLMAIDRDDYKRKIAGLAHKYQEPVMLVTGDIEQIYFPMIHKNFPDLVKGEWAPVISHGMEKVMSDQELAVAGALAQPIGQMEPRVMLKIPQDADTHTILERRMDLLKRGLRIELDEEELKRKTIVQGYLAPDGVAAQDISLG